MRVSANGDGDPSKFSASCGTLAQANPQWSGYTYKAFWNDNNNGVDNYFINKFQGIQAFGSAYKDVYVLSNLTEVATVTTELVAEIKMMATAYLRMEYM